MKLIITFLLSLNLFAFTIHDYTMKSSKGKDVNFEDFKGKPIVLVNIATKCGYTPQLKDIESFHKKYKDKVVVLGVPSNDFGGQTPESDKGVAEFCQRNYGVTFPIMRKTVVKGSDSHPLFKKLKELNKNQDIQWNFEKFLFNKNGEFVSNFSSNVNPMDKKFISKTESVL